MKKLISILLVLATIFLFASCERFGNRNDKTTTLITDENGQPVTGENQSGGSDATGKDALTGTKAPETQPDTLPQGEKVSVEVDKKGTPKNLLFEKYVKPIIKSKMFTVDAKATAPFEGSNNYIPLVMHYDKNRAAFDVSMDFSSMLTGADLAQFKTLLGSLFKTGSTLKLRMLFMDGKSYIVNVNANKYMEDDMVSSEDMSEVFSGAFGMNSEGSKYVETTKVKYSGKTYTCESYSRKDEDGANILLKYYFLGNDLKRIETSSPDFDSDSSVIEINSIKGTVDNKPFILPNKKVESAEALILGL